MRRDREWTWWGEMSGAIGDLGITLPLAFALAHTSGIPIVRILLLWGLAYVGTGLYYRVPVSVQPLKAMAVIAIGLGLGGAVLSTAAVGYGLLFVLLAATGLTRRLDRLFSRALVRGIQLGIGIMLLKKSLTLVWKQGWVLGRDGAVRWEGLLAAAAVVALLLVAAKVFRRNVSLPVILVAMLAGVLMAGRWTPPSGGGGLLAPHLPGWRDWPNLFLLLMLPQLPLTLGNAVIAASDACRQYFPGRGERATVDRLAGTIGLADVGIGLLGGFPICHGAGGIAAHARFGGRTGRTTVLIGSVFVVVGLIPGAGGVLMRTPVPVLGALLALASWEMIVLVRRLATRGEVLVACVVAAVSVTTRNLAFGLAAGWILERIQREVLHGSHRRDLHESREGDRQDVRSPRRAEARLGDRG